MKKIVVFIMSSIKNVAMGYSNTDSVVLATTGVAACVAVVVTLENDGLFFAHQNPTRLFATKFSSLDETQKLLEGVVAKLFKSNNNCTIESVYLIGGSVTSAYRHFGNNINALRQDGTVTARFEKNITTVQLRSFLSRIKINNVTFNIRKQRAAGNGSESDDEKASDDPNDYISDCTVVCDKSETPTLLAILQYSGREYQLNASSRQISPFVVYKIDPTTSNIKGYLHPATIANSPYGPLISAQVLNNVMNPSSIDQHGSNSEFERKLASLVLRSEPPPDYNDEDDEDDD